MESEETLGIVLDAREGRNFDGIACIDVFTENHGIVRLFNKSREKIGVNCVFENVAMIKKMTSGTIGNFYKIKILSENAKTMRINGSYDHGRMFVETLRHVVFDGVSLRNLFIITRQAISNFASKHDANVVMLKALYLLCREEGYAVDLSWMNSLSPSNKALARKVISSNFDCESSDQIWWLIESLQRWILSL
jgi:hypothetical protein